MPGKIGNYVLPERLRTQAGTARHVGFEVEFAGLEFKDTVRVVSEVFGVSALTHTQAEASILHPELGKFTIEVDSELAKQLAKARADGRNEPSEEDPLAEWLVNLTTELVPVEVVCPPIAIERLPALDAMIRSLREAGAEGTAESVVYAFGVHINTELPALTPGVIGRYLRAYVIAQDWLLRRHRVDLTRRFTPYIDLYPAGYRRRVLEYRDDVSLDTLLTDYLEYNATRNRALDMLPLFKHIAEERVSSMVTDSRVNSRPTFHYRLPNCEIERGDWGLSESWNIWCVIEALSNDAERLDELSHQCRSHDAHLINLTRAPWHKTLDSILNDLVSA